MQCLHQPLECCALLVDFKIHLVTPALSFECRLELFLPCLELNRQTMAIPARNILGLSALKQLEPVDDVLEDLHPKKGIGRIILTSCAV